MAVEFHLLATPAMADECRQFLEPQKYYAIKAGIEAHRAHHTFLREQDFPMPNLFRFKTLEDRDRVQHFLQEWVVRRQFWWMNAAKNNFVEYGTAMGMSADVIGRHLTNAKQYKLLLCVREARQYMQHWLEFVRVRQARRAMPVSSMTVAQPCVVDVVVDHEQPILVPVAPLKKRFPEVRPPVPFFAGDPLSTPLSSCGALEQGGNPQVIDETQAAEIDEIDVIDDDTKVDQIAIDETQAAEIPGETKSVGETEQEENEEEGPEQVSSDPYDFEQVCFGEEIVSKHDLSALKDFADMDTQDALEYDESDNDDESAAAQSQAPGEKAGNKRKRYKRFLDEMKKACVPWVEACVPVPVCEPSRKSRKSTSLL